jgi:cytochrome c oxidase subunit 2
MIGRIAPLVLLVGCRPMRVLEPDGPAAGAIAELSFVLFAGTLLPTAVVFAILALAYLRAKRRAKADQAPDLDPGTRAITIGTILVTIVIVGLLAATLRAGRAIAARRAPPNLVIEIVGHQFWWEVRYPAQGFVTANEIHVPTGARVEVKLSSADVIHSFWIPELHGKMDLTPGHPASITIEPTVARRYFGPCMEFCGVTHAFMALELVAEPPERFEAWLRAQTPLAADGATDRERDGRAIFSRERCDSCHVVRGHFQGALPGLAPDLTHFGGRAKLAAAIFPNDDEHLRTWIRDARAMKPGVRMPAYPLEAADLDALVSYLRGLR